MHAVETLSRIWLRRVYVRGVYADSMATYGIPSDPLTSNPVHSPPMFPDYSNPPNPALPGRKSRPTHPLVMAQKGKRQSTQ